MDITGQHGKTTLFTCHKPTALISIEVTTSETVTDIEVESFYDHLI